jgi:hypothetical protein
MWLRVHLFIYGGRTPATYFKYRIHIMESSWTEVNDLNTSRQGLGGAGTSNTSALGTGGVYYLELDLKQQTESWNGTILDRS